MVLDIPRVELWDGRAGYPAGQPGGAYYPGDGAIFGGHGGSEILVVVLEDLQVVNLPELEDQNIKEDLLVAQVVALAAAVTTAAAVVADIIRWVVVDLDTFISDLEVSLSEAMVMEILVLEHQASHPSSYP